MPPPSADDFYGYMQYIANSIIESHFRFLSRTSKFSHKFTERLQLLVDFVLLQTPYRGVLSPGGPGPSSHSRCGNPKRAT